MEQTDFSRHEQIIYFSYDFTTAHYENEVRSCIEADGTMSGPQQELVRFLFLPPPQDIFIRNLYSHITIYLGHQISKANDQKAHW